MQDDLQERRQMTRIPVHTIADAPEKSQVIAARFERKTIAPAVGNEDGCGFNHYAGTQLDMPTAPAIPEY
jgi:hypothetical protein